MLLDRIPLVLAISLCIALSGSFYWQLSPFVQSFGQAQQKPSSLDKQNTISPETSKRSHNIANFQLFGDTKMLAKKIAPSTQILPKTNLKLTLTGVFVSKDPIKAGALIQGPNRDTISYKIGDELPGGATLKEVFADRVIIERSGRLENLVFIETKGIGIERYSHIDDDEPTFPVNKQNRPSFPNNSQRGAPVSAQRTLGIKERLSKLRKRILKNRP